MIFLALTITATAIVYQAGVPLVQELQASAAVDKMKITLSDLDALIRQVAAEGKGSKRTFSISSDPGKLVIDGTTDTITWTFDSEAEIISPGTQQTFGNLVVGSNLETNLTEGTYDRLADPVDAYILQNEHLDVYINKSGTASEKVPMKTTALVLGIYNKDLDAWWEDPVQDITIDDEGASSDGTGYTIAEATGSSLPQAKVTAHMLTSYVNWRLHFILLPGADFLTIEAEEA